MQSIRTSKVVIRAAVLGTLLLAGVAGAAFHSHEADQSRTCTACAFTSTPGDFVLSFEAEPRSVDTGEVTEPSRRPIARRYRTSRGSRAPPA